MNFSEIFAAYYTQYRGESQIPANTDDEYTIALRLANEGINHWANYEGVYWKELWTTHQTDNTGDQVIVTGTTDYDCSTAMREAGGYVKVLDTDGNVVTRYPIVEPQEVQFLNPEGTYCYFTGSPGSYVLHLNKAPDDSLNGLSIDFDFYKFPTEMVDDTSVPQMSNPYFLVHHMLGNRFRASRNWSAYQTAKRDSENALKVMQMDNNSGTWANHWSLADNSGSSWGM